MIRQTQKIQKITNIFSKCYDKKHHSHLDFFIHTYHVCLIK